MISFHFAPHAARAIALRRLLYVPLLLLMAACEDDFSPIEPSDLKLSIFGYLDVSADTQWVRVMPIRTTVPSGPSPPPAVVTLENMETGVVVELRDSLFHFDIGEHVGSEGLYLHNYWTVMPVEPGAEYRLVATPVDGGQTAEAMIRMPPAYGTEVWLAQPWTNVGDRLRLEGLTHLALLSLTTVFHDDCGSSARRGFIEGGSPTSDVQSVPITKSFRPRDGCGPTLVERREFFVVGSGSPWPAVGELAVGRLYLPDAPANVTGAIGFLGGVLTRQVPYEHCSLEPVPGAPSHCVLRYDEDTASFGGRVLDVACEGEPVSRAAVELREVLPRPTGRKLRGTTSNPSGEFLIDGLDPEQRYALSVRRFVRDDPFDQYREHQDTLTFASGEDRLYEVPLERFVCDG